MVFPPQHHLPFPRGFNRTRVESGGGEILPRKYKKGGGEMKRGILVGRHELLEAQQRALQELKIEIVDKIEQIDVNRASQLEGVDVVVVQALPISILAQILPILRRKGISVYMFEQDAVNRELLSPDEAQKIIAQKPDRRVALVSLTNGNEKVRVVEFRRVVEVKEIEIKKEIVWQVE